MNNKKINNFLKDSRTNWKYILIVVILAAIVGGGILGYQWWMEKQEVPIPEFSKVKKSEGGAATREIILSDEEITGILRVFAVKKTARFQDVEVDNILLDALEFKNAGIKDRLQNLIIKFEGLSEKIEDAPDLRSWKIQRTKLCIAESIIFNDVENTTQRCGYELDFSFTGADDLLADTQILPFFINGYAYYSENNYSKANYYFYQVKLHRHFLENFGVDLNDSYLELYNKIYNKVLEISPEEVTKDETAKTANWRAHIKETEFLDVDEEITAGWKTYFNKNYNYQLKIPNNWGQISAYDGSFIPEISPYNDYYVPLGANDGSESIATGHYRNRDKYRYSIDWYIDFYINKEYQIKLIKTRYCEITEIYIPEINERLAASNRYTYLIEKDDYLFEIGFLNKNEVTEQIIANLKFFD